MYSNTVTNEAFSIQRSSFRLRRTLQYRRKPVIAAAARFFGEPVVEEARVPDNNGRTTQVARQNEQDARRAACPLVPPWRIPE
jgi:hypothetical protein